MNPIRWLRRLLGARPTPLYGNLVKCRADLDLSPDPGRADLDLEELLRFPDRRVTPVGPAAFDSSAIDEPEDPVHRIMKDIDVTLAKDKGDAARRARRNELARSRYRVRRIKRAVEELYALRKALGGRSYYASCRKLCVPRSPYMLSDEQRKELRRALLEKLRLKAMGKKKVARGRKSR